MHHLPRWAHWGTIMRSRGMHQPPRWGHWGILTCLGALGYLGGTAPNAAGKLANRAKLGPFTSLPAMAAVRFLFKNVDICTISANHAFQASPQSHYERIAFIQHGFFRIVPSTRHHSTSRKSCAVIPSVAASQRCAYQTLENHGAARDSFPAQHRPMSTSSTKKFYTL